MTTSTTKILQLNGWDILNGIPVLQTSVSEIGLVDPLSWAVGELDAPLNADHPVVVIEVVNNTDTPAFEQQFDNLFSALAFIASELGEEA